MKNLRSQIKLTFLLSTITLAATAFAVSPPPDGGYPNNNTAEGDSALFGLTTGSNNTAIGFAALFSNTTGSNNTAIGLDALHSNTTGFNNTAIGVVALESNTTGAGNTANGTSALSRNTTGLNNTANGGSALFNNTKGINNTASGWGALFSNQTGLGNVAVGASAANSTTGDFNTASGYQALFSNNFGGFNTASGYQALKGTTGSKNIGLGSNAGKNLSTGSNNIDIGNEGVPGDSGVMRFGTEGTQTATFIAGITMSPLTAGTAFPVGITSTGQLGVRASSASFKEAIKPMDRASEAILSLKPVTFHYKKELDPKGLPQFGLIAEEVAKVHPDLVVSDEKGKPFTVRYDEVNAMLLNEFLKEHRKVEEQQTAINQLDSKVTQQEDLRATVAQQQKQIDALTSQIQKVSDQLAAGKTAPPMLVKDR